MRIDGAIGYLVGAYPIFEQTFISREVRALRAAGLDIHTCSLRCPAPNMLKTDAERDEYERTFYVQRSGVLNISLSHLECFVRFPLRYLSALLFALSLSSGGLKATVWSVFYFVEAIVLGVWARKTGVAFVHVHIATAACAVALIASRIRFFRYSVTANGPYIFDNVEPLRLAEKLGGAECVVCISDYDKSQVMRILPPEMWPKIVVVRHAVDVQQFRAPVRHHRASGEMTVLCVGRLSRTKAQRVLIEALSRLRQKGIAVRCIIVGDGPEREPLKRFAEDLQMSEWVNFAGPVGEDKIRRFYEEADVFVSASLAEGIPNVLMEAMAMELPVVSTRLMGTPELVVDNVNGLMVVPGSVNELAAAVERLILDDELRRRLGAAGREKVVAEYNLTQNAGRLAELIRDCRDSVCANIEDGDVRKERIEAARNATRQLNSRAQAGGERGGIKVSEDV